MEEEIEHLTRLVKHPNRPLVSIIGGAKIETKLPVINALSKISDKVLVGGILPKEISEKNISFDSNVIVAELVESGKDVSTKSVEDFEKIINTAKEIVWNGPIGNFEQELYSAGTKTLVEILMRCNAKITVGGGDTISALNQFGDISKVDWVSLGGGAMLDFIAGEKMPGIEALERS
jgi:phosphoglycerate kinase